jgi:hypothetical protein
MLRIKLKPFVHNDLALPSALGSAILSMDATLALLTFPLPFSMSVFMLVVLLVIHYFFTCHDCALIWMSFAVIQS